MSSANPIRNISDTALWVAVYRARESEHPGALFHDPYARKLAGDRGMEKGLKLRFIRFWTARLKPRPFKTDL